MDFKTALYTIVLTAALTLFAGCQSSQKDQPDTVPDPNAAQVVLVGTDTFPKHMAGIWLEEKLGWVFRIEEDGRVTKIKHTIGRVNMTAGKKSTFPLWGGGEGFMEPGPWFTQYNALSKELVIEITLKDFKYEIGPGGENVVYGSSRDLFSGTIPAEGETTWQADWFSFPKYLASTADKTYQHYELPFDEGQEDMGPVVFEKINPEELN